MESPGDRVTRPTPAQGGAPLFPDVLVNGSATQTSESFVPPPSLASERFPTVPGYEVLARLGQGGMGTVFRARDLSLGREVALKWLPAGASGRQHERFRREALAGAALRHPFVATVFARGTTPDGDFIAMELVDGLSLAAVFEARGLGPATLAGVLGKVARALAAAHALGVVHRDVKPANVVLDGAGDPHLVDLGLARFLFEEGTLTVANVALGTFAYMSPEVALGGAATAGPPCDVFSLGCTLFEGLVGRPPFLGADALETVTRLSRCEVPPFPSDAPSALVSLCRDALALEPAERPSAAVFAERAEAAARELARGVPPTGPTRAPRPDRTPAQATIPSSASPTATVERPAPARLAVTATTPSSAPLAGARPRPFVAVGLGAVLVGALLVAATSGTPPPAPTTPGGAPTSTPPEPAPPPTTPPSPAGARDTTRWESWDFATLDGTHYPALWDAIAGLGSSSLAVPDRVARTALEGAAPSERTPRVAILRLIRGRLAFLEKRLADAETELAPVCGVVGPMQPRVLLHAGVVAALMRSPSVGARRALLAPLEPAFAELVDLSVSNLGKDGALRALAGFASRNRARFNDPLFGNALAEQIRTPKVTPPDERRR